MKIKRISSRFALLLALAAVLPLLAYGFISLWSLQSGTRSSIIAGNLNVATRAAEEMRRYVTGNAEIIKALGADLHNTGLEPWQQDRILKNYVLRFREFREITLFDENGRLVATSRIGRPHAAVPTEAHLAIDGVDLSPIRVDEELLPTVTFAVPLMRLNMPAGWLVGEFSLEEMWRMVDRIRIGDHGFAMVIAPDGNLIAHGDADKKALVAQMRNMSAHPLVAAIRGQSGGAPVAQEYLDEDRHSNLGVATRIPLLDWTVIVEQPTIEAYATGSKLQRQLGFAISVALLVMVLVGYFFGRSFINPILRLKGATHLVAAGDLETRVDIHTGDEFEDLGDAFNSMANKLVELQENVKRQERQAMFGRVAAGLVHDLSHPVQNIGNSARLLLRDDADLETREMFRRTVDRELATLKRFLDDLRNVARPKPVERFPLEVNASAAEVVDAMRGEGERTGVTLEAHYGPGPLVIDGDRFALGRVYRNLITNAIQATEAGGRVTLTTRRDDGYVEIIVADTGSGIPADRLPAIFDDFVTTKRRGLGLGLAVSKRIVEQLGGTITVKSEVGRGTAFTLRFPALNDRTAEAAAS